MSLSTYEADGWLDGNEIGKRCFEDFDIRSRKGEPVRNSCSTVL